MEKMAMNSRTPIIRNVYISWEWVGTTAFKRDKKQKYPKKNQKSNDLRK
jgi:hypothetical protein